MKMIREVVYKPSEKSKTIYTGGTLTPPKFMPTYYEWLISRGTQITASKGTFGTGLTIYTIPKNFIFFMTSASISIQCMSGTDVQRIATLTDDGSNQILTTTIVGANTASSSTQSFSMPIKIDSGSVKGIQSPNTFGAYTIQGFLVKSKDFLRF